MKLFQRSLLIIAVAAAVVFAAGCPERRSIADIERNPGRYEGKKVTVVGVVRNSYGVGIPGMNVGGGAYEIDDGTGTIWVMATDRSVPSKGGRLAVEGRVGSGVNWKGRNYGLGIYEDKRHYEKR